MSVLDTIRGIVKAKSMPPMVHWLYRGDGAPRRFEVGKHYLRLWASDMYLRYQRIGPWGICPGVQTLVVLTFGDQKVEIPGFIGPGKIAKSEASGVSSVRMERQVLTQQLPYRGGLVEVESVLLQLPGDDYFQAFTSFLSGVADTLVLGEVSATLDIAEKVGSGVADLLGISEQGKLALGWMSDFPDQGESALHDGFVLLLPNAAMRPDQLASLSVNGGVLYQNSQRFQGTDFLLLEFELVEKRVDWEEISSIARPLQRAREQADQGEAAQARAFFQAAILAVRQTRDLTLADKEAAIASIKSWMPVPTALPDVAAFRRDPYEADSETDAA